MNILASESETHSDEFYLEHRDLIRTINREFKIVLDQDGLYNGKLIGAGKYNHYVGDNDLALYHFNKAINCTKDFFRVNLRRGLTITFYSK